MVTIVNGDLLTTDADVICHQVNCQGKMSSGIAKSIRDKWPIVYQRYIMKYMNDSDSSSKMLGDIQIVALDHRETEKYQCVINMFAQFNYGYDGKKYTSYDAFWQCLGGIKDAIPVNKSIAFPYGIGCNRGGANWEVIYTMIKEVLSDHEVFIYKLEN